MEKKNMRAPMHALNGDSFLQLMQMIFLQNNGCGLRRGFDIVNVMQWCNEIKQRQRQTASGVSASAPAHW